MKQIKHALLGLLVMLALFAPVAYAFAQTTGSGDPKNKTFQLVPCIGVASASSSGPECDFNQLIVMFNRIISFLLYLSVPLVLGMIMFTAFKYLTANGDPGKLASAKKMLVPVVIGIFWVLGSWIVVKVFLANLLTDSQAKENVIFLDVLK